MESARLPSPKIKVTEEPSPLPEPLFVINGIFKPYIKMRARDLVATHKSAYNKERLKRFIELIEKAHSLECWENIIKELDGEINIEHQETFAQKIKSIVATQHLFLMCLISARTYICNDLENNATWVAKREAKYQKAKQLEEKIQAGRGSSADAGSLQKLIEERKKLLESAARDYHHKAISDAVGENIFAAMPDVLRLPKTTPHFPDFLQRNFYLCIHTHVAGEFMKEDIGTTFDELKNHILATYKSKNPLPTPKPRLEGSGETKLPLDLGSSSGSTKDLLGLMTGGATSPGTPGTSGTLSSSSSSSSSSLSSTGGSTSSTSVGVTRAPSPSPEPTEERNNEESPRATTPKASPATVGTFKDDEKKRKKTGGGAPKHKTGAVLGR